MARNSGRRAGGASAGTGFAWSLANAVATKAGTFLIGIVLARVLGPEAFGTYAVALVALLAVLSFNELGVSLAIVRWPEDPREIAPTVATISLLTSLLLTVAAVLAAPAFTALMGAPEATGVVQLLAVNVAIGGLVATPAALMQRVFDERTRTVIDQGNVWIGAIVSVLLALAGLGAMSLAIGRTAGSLVSALMFLRRSPLPIRLGWNRQYVPALLRFGLPLAGTSIVMFLVGYADQFIGGAMLGATALGFYVLAYNLSTWPLSIISQPLRRVAPAALAALQQEQAAQRRVLATLFSAVAAVALPAFLALAAAAEPVVRLVYGQTWLPSAAALSWLVAAAAARVFQELIYDYLVVLSRTGAIFRIQVIGLVVLLPALFIGAQLDGITGLAAAQAAVAGLVTLPLYLFQLRRSGFMVSLLAAGCWRAVLAAGLWAVAVWFLVQVMENFLTALLCVGVGTLGLSAVLLWTQRRALAMVRAIGTASLMERAR